MTGYIIRRLFIGAIMVVLISMIVFSLVRYLPGDPLLLYFSENEIDSYSIEDIYKLRAEYGLDKPSYEQYISWVNDVIHGDLGVSLNIHAPVITLIKERLPVTLYLGLLSMIIGTLLGILFGVTCALRRGTWIDNVLTTLANLGICVPGFWVAIMLIYFFALQLHWLPTYGFTSPFQDFGLSIRQTILPVACLSLGTIAGITRLARSSTLEVTRQDYVRTAWAKGLTERNVVMRHIIKNSLVPVITVLGMHVQILFSGAVIIETVFNIPGIGRLLTSAVFSKDYQIVQAGALFTAIIVILSNITVDVVYGWLDPRIRYE